MRLVVLHGTRNTVTRPSFRLLQAPLRVQRRTIAVNTKPRHERPPPIFEQINLRPQANPRAQSIGVLGGGITGLTTAWQLKEFLPDAKITLYEKEDRLGGWLNSEIVETDGGEVLFEWGPRSLRPDPAGTGRATILLLLQLGLYEEIIGIPKGSPAALNRFIYFGDRLVQMPGPNPSLPPFLNIIRNGFKLITEPIFDGMIRSALAENWVQQRPSNMTDESVGDFISRRFGKTAADNLASAFFHGIYAGDLYKLSARTLLPALWHMETRDPDGSGILMEMVDIAFKGQGLMQFKHGRYVDLLEATQTSSNATEFLQTMQHDLNIYTFNRGLGMLRASLQKSLEDDANTTIQTNTEVTNLSFDPQSKKFNLVINDKASPTQHDYIVSTLSPGHISTFLKNTTKSQNNRTPNPETIKALEESNKSVTVGVVNLYYQNPNLVSTSYRGFGYLIPRSISIDSNPERALGVLFSSESSGARGKDAVQKMPNPAKARLQQMDAMIDAAEEAQKTQATLSASSSSSSSSSSASEQISAKAQEQFDTWLTELRTRRAEAAGEIPDGVDSLPDEITMRAGQDTAPGTKLTIMIGGHWWDGWQESDLPTEDELIDMAKTLLARHLKIMEAPLVAKAKMNYNCIPQYTVGYRQRMASVHRGLMEEFHGRLKVAGPWWQGGVGVNDCIFGSHLTAFNIREEWDDETGLKDYTEKEKWLICDRRTQTFAVDPVK